MQSFQRLWVFGKHRHTYATELYRTTKDIRLVQKALGHAQLSTTMIYTHIVDDDLETAMRTLNL
jgi:integrase/recombinase XerD